MTASKKPPQPNDTPPATTPQAESYKYAVDKDYATSLLMEMQKSLGKIESTLERLVASDERTKDKLGRVEKVMYAAGVIMLVGLGVGGWMLNAAKDFAMTYYKASLEAQKPTVPPPTPPAKQP